MNIVILNIATFGLPYESEKKKWWGGGGGGRGKTRKNLHL